MTLINRKNMDVLLFFGTISGLICVCMACQAQEASTCYSPIPYDGDISELCGFFKDQAECLSEKLFSCSPDVGVDDRKARDQANQIVALTCSKPSKCSAPELFSCYNITTLYDRTSFCSEIAGTRECISSISSQCPQTLFPSFVTSLGNLNVVAADICSTSQPNCDVTNIKECLDEIDLALANQGTFCQTATPATTCLVNAMSGCSDQFQAILNVRVLDVQATANALCPASVTLTTITRTCDVIQAIACIRDLDSEAPSCGKADEQIKCLDRWLSACDSVVREWFYYYEGPAENFMATLCADLADENCRGIFVCIGGIRSSLNDSPTRICSTFNTLKECMTTALGVCDAANVPLYESGSNVTDEIVFHYCSTVDPGSTCDTEAAQTCIPTSQELQNFDCEDYDVMAYCLSETLINCTDESRLIYMRYMSEIQGFLAPSCQRIIIDFPALTTRGPEATEPATGTVTESKPATEPSKKPDTKTNPPNNNGSNGGNVAYASFVMIAACVIYAFGNRL